MSEPRIGRVLVASMHQSIQDLLPNRLDFYENWLSTSGLREGTIGLAPLAAVLSFLRGEGDRYDAVTARAGEYAAEWTVTEMSGLERRFIRTLPLRWRMRRALSLARLLVTATYPGTRTRVRRRRGSVSIELRGSLFCEVREPSMRPLCGFYAAAVRRMLEQFAVPAEVLVGQCRATGTGRECLLSVAVRRPAATPAAAAS